MRNLLENKNVRVLEFLSFLVNQVNLFQNLNRLSNLVLNLEALFEEKVYT